MLKGAKHVSPADSIHESLLSDPLLMNRLNHLLRDTGKLDHPFVKQLNEKLPQDAAARISWRALSGILEIPLNELAESIGLYLREEMPGNMIEQPADFEIADLRQKEAVEFDVRPLLMKGVEPFRAIKKRLFALENTQFLKLTVDFEPIPLYAYARNWGFELYTEKKGGVFEVYFKKGKVKVFPEKDGFADVALEDLAATEKHLKKELPSSFMEIDVRELPAPEPAGKAIAILSDRPDLLMLKMIHRKRPDFLSPMIRKFGFVVAPFLTKTEQTAWAESWTIYLFYQYLLISNERKK